MKKSIILSFDYEMFFGDAPGTIQESVLKPTNLILDELERVNGRATFFVDYLMIKRCLQENTDTKRDALLIIEQLKRIIRVKSRIELHLHTHWIDATYNDGNWSFVNYEHYCLNSLDERTITNLFIEGTLFLESIANEVEPCYKIKGFRAGGWQILPFDLIKPGFEAAKLIFDSSLLPGRVLSSYDILQDFSNVPHLLSYTFKDDPRFPNSDGKFVEIPITTFRYSLIIYCISHFYSRFMRNKIYRLADGSHARKDLQKNDNKETFLERIYRLNVFTINNYHPFVLKMITSLYAKEITVFMCHPKDYTTVTIKNIATIAKRYELITYIDYIKR